MRAHEVPDGELFFTRELFEKGQPYEELRETYYRRKRDGYRICGYCQGGINPKTKRYRPRAKHTALKGIGPVYALTMLGMLPVYPRESSVFLRKPRPSTPSRDQRDER